MSRLVMVGFASSAVSSLYVGSALDRFGRKRGCLAFVALQVGSPPSEC
jgi:MFS family permease